MFDTTADRKLEHQHTVGQSSHNNYTVNNSKKVRRQRALDAGERLKPTISSSSTIIHMSSILSPFLL